MKNIRSVQEKASLCNFKLHAFQLIPLLITVAYEAKRTLEKTYCYLYLLNDIYIKQCEVFLKVFFFFIFQTVYHFFSIQLKKTWYFFELL